MSETKLYPRIIDAFQQGENDKKEKKKYSPPRDKKLKKAYRNGYYGI